MTSDKAIEELQFYLDEQKIFPNSDLANSLKLGIEALKVTKANRDPNLPIYIGLLPGETK